MCKSKLLLVLGLLLFAVPTLTRADDGFYWPTSGWRASTPEAQGIDSARIRVIPDGMFGPHTSLVIRHGYVVVDASVYPFSASQQHALVSVAGSVVSTLIGIAIDKGYIQGVEQSIWDFLPKAQYADMDARKEAITIRHLLTHRSGLSIVQPVVWTDLNFLTESDQDWVKYVLDKPMSEAPGTRFNYLDANPLLLSTILQMATKQTALEFAKENLFGPLGITDFIWLANPQGITIGNDELYMSPLDLAKLGYLYLHGGQWDGNQIVSTAWIEATITEVIPTYRSCKQVSTDQHGFLWWVSDVGGSGTMGYAALGYGGQELWVIPDLDLIVVFTSGPRDGQTRIAGQLLPAVQADSPLPANPVAEASLNEKIRALAHPAPSAVDALSEVMQRASGQRYQLKDNSLGWKTLQVEFGKQEAHMKIEWAGKPVDLPIGLDGVYRVSTDTLPTDPARKWMRPDIPIALRGFITAQQDQLQIYGWDLAGRDSWAITLVFKPNRVNASVSVLGQKWLIFGSK